MPARGKQYSDFHYPELQGGLSTRTVKLENLYLDVENPRLLGNLKAPVKTKAGSWEWIWDCAKCQELVRRELVDNNDGESLMNSISSLGFLPMDRVVVFEREPDKYVVLEGNRRVSCLKSLFRFNEIGLRKLPASVVETFEEFEVLVLNSEDLDKDTFLLQAVRHISGVRPWGPYQQARMIYNCVVEKGMSYKETGAAVGLSATKASSLLHAYLGVKQMEEDPVYGKHASPSFFSHFDQAFRQTSIRDWLQWDEGSKLYANAENFQKFCELILDGNPATGQRAILAQEIRDVLPKVFGNESAKREFLAGHVSITQAGSIVPEIPNPSLVLRKHVGKIGKALDDLPEGFLCSKEGLHDMRQIQSLKDRLDELLLSYTKNRLSQAA